MAAKKSLYVKMVACKDCGESREVRKDSNPKRCKLCSCSMGGKSMKGKYRIARQKCKVCDNEFSKNSRVAYCSVKCSSIDKRVNRTCKSCGKEFTILKSILKTNASGNFCARGCYNNWMCQTDRVTGRGSQWNKIRKAVLKKTPFCIICGANQKLQVHHVVPFRLTHDNSENNLVPLCVKHHKYVESITHDIEKVETDLKRMRFILMNIFIDIRNVTFMKLKVMHAKGQSHG